MIAKDNLIAASMRLNGERFELLAEPADSAASRFVGRLVMTRSVVSVGFEQFVFVVDGPGLWETAHVARIAFSAATS